MMEKTIKERIADAHNKYRREIDLPRDSRLVTNIMRKGEIVERVYETSEGKRRVFLTGNDLTDEKV